MGFFSQKIKPIFRYIQNQLDEPAVVLLYHRVEQLTDDYQQLAVSPDNFEHQIRLLKENYNLLTIDEFVEIKLKGTKFPPRSVIITFDDGYADNLLKAVPILEKLQAQALFYITVSKLGTDELLWWDFLEQIFKEQLPNSLTLFCKGKKVNFENVQSNKLDVLSKLHYLIKYNSIAERERLLMEVSRWAGYDPKSNDSNRLLTHAELQQMAQSSSCVIGAHTVDHPVLSQLSYSEQSQQIAESATQLQSLIQKEIKHFSYPFGGKMDYDANSIRVCKDLGFDMVTSNFPWQVHSYTDRFQIPRYLVRNWDVKTFESKLKLFFTR